LQGIYGEGCGPNTSKKDWLVLVDFDGALGAEPSYKYYRFIQIYPFFPIMAGTKEPDNLERRLIEVCYTARRT
jgi:hypothetical protein